MWLLVLSFTLSQMAQRSSVGVFWAIPPQFLGGTAAAAGIALINSIGNLGGFVGPTIIGALHDLTGGYTGGLLAFTAALVVEAVLVLSLRLPPRCARRAHRSRRPREGRMTCLNERAPQTDHDGPDVRFVPVDPIQLAAAPAGGRSADGAGRLGRRRGRAWRDDADRCRVGATHATNEGASSACTSRSRRSCRGRIPRCSSMRCSIAKEAGATSLRVVCLLGRRYEMFDTLDEWKTAIAGFHKQIAVAVPIAEQHRMPLGIENHKDWRVDQQVALLEQVQQRVPWRDARYRQQSGGPRRSDGDRRDCSRRTRSTRTSRTWRSRSTDEGFLLSEVPLGEGMLDMKRMADIIKRARPDVHFSLEMITRDPLKVPCLTDKYWATFDGVERRAPGADVVPDPRQPATGAAAAHHGVDARGTGGTGARSCRTVDRLRAGSSGAGVNGVPRIGHLRDPR